MWHFPKKVSVVRETLASWQEQGHCNEFNYILIPFESENEDTGDITTYLSQGEHFGILKYLASKGHIEIINSNLSGSVRVKILPQDKPTIALKTIKLIAIDLGGYCSGTNIVSFLTEVGADKRFIIYPETKWVIVYTVLAELAISHNSEDKDLLFKIITGSIHPLNLNGNPRVSEELKIKFNYYLSFDGFEIYNTRNEGVYEISHLLTNE